MSSTVLLAVEVVLGKNESYMDRGRWRKWDRDPKVALCWSQFCGWRRFETEGSVILIRLVAGSEKEREGGRERKVIMNNKEKEEGGREEGREGGREGGRGRGGTKSVTLCGRIKRIK